MCSGRGSHTGLHQIPTDWHRTAREDPSSNSGGSTCAAGAGVLTLNEGRWERAVWKGTVFIIGDPNRVRAAMQVRVQQWWTLALLRGY